VALVEAGAITRIDVGDRLSWLVRPSGGARLLPDNVPPGYLEVS